MQDDCMVMVIIIMTEFFPSSWFWSRWGSGKDLQSWVCAACAAAPLLSLSRMTWPGPRIATTVTRWWPSSTWWLLSSSWWSYSSSLWSRSRLLHYNTACALFTPGRGLLAPPLFYHQKSMSTLPSLGCSLILCFVCLSFSMAGEGCVGWANAVGSLPSIFWWNKYLLVNFLWSSKLEFFPWRENGRRG